MNSALWCSKSAPPRPEFDHWTPVRPAAVSGVPNLKAFYDELELFAADHPAATRAAILSLAPWFAVWLHHVQDFASKLPLDRRWTRIVAHDLTSLETALVAEWAVHCGARFEVTPSPESVKGETSIGRRSAALRALVRAPKRLDSCPDVLLLTLQSNSTKALIPLADELKRRGATCAFGVLATDGSSISTVTGAAHSAIALEHHFPLRALLDFPAAATALRKLLRSRPLWERLAGNLLPNWLPVETLSRLLERSLRRRFWPAWAKAHAVGRLHRRFPASRVVFSSDHGLVAHTLPPTNTRSTVLFLQGVIPPIPSFYQRLNVTRALIGSEFDQNFTRSSGIPDERVSRIGYGDYALLASFDRASTRSSLRNELGLTSDAKLVTFTSQYATDLFPDWARRANIEALTEAARRLPEVTFLLKVHPRRENLTKEARVSLPSNVHVLDRGHDIRALILGSDVVVTYWSTTALETLLLDVPLVQLNATGLADFYPITERYQRETARTPDSLVKTLLELLAPQTAEAVRALQRSFLETFEIPAPASAPERAANATLSRER